MHRSLAAGYAVAGSKQSLNLQPWQMVPKY